MAGWDKARDKYENTTGCVYMGLISRKTYRQATKSVKAAAPAFLPVRIAGDRAGKNREVEIKLKKKLISFDDVTKRKFKFSIVVAFVNMYCKLQTHTLFVDAFLQNNRLDHVSQGYGISSLILGPFSQDTEFHTQRRRTTPF
ncbi:hypothetical protein NQ317_017562 [Molorchus minor]|uniref:Uncharacterized protein n=1 Tax=Molorchus minor TaxID=1323400 RepID=A0ABQ9J7Z4_9CUCU|nr:hypothetical protein NQ317_017562 [Molorchus minor]